MIVTPASISAWITFRFVSIRAFTLASSAAGTPIPRNFAASTYGAAFTPGSKLAASTLFACPAISPQPAVGSTTVPCSFSIAKRKLRRIGIHIHLAVRHHRPASHTAGG